MTTPARIHADMVKELASYLERHPEDTTAEAAVKHEIIVPPHWAETFLLAANKLQVLDKSYKEMEKATFGVARHTSSIIIPTKM